MLEGVFASMDCGECTVDGGSFVDGQEPGRVETAPIGDRLDQVGDLNVRLDDSPVEAWGAVDRRNVVL